MRRPPEDQEIAALGLALCVLGLCWFVLSVTGAGPP